MAKKSNINKPKILIWDLETAPMLGYIWKLWDNDVALNQLHTDWYILSWSAKWHGDDKVMYMDQRNAPNIEDDRKLLKGIWKLLDQADVVVTQNGKSFDQKRLNARFILNGIKPPSSYRHVDTKVLAKRHFGFTSNRLEYMTKKLCKKYVKSSHAKFSGFALWKECLNGNKEAWKEMEHYNKYDVLSLEELYDIMIPWDNTINHSIFNDGEHVCSCGSSKLQKNGTYYTNAGQFQRYRCTNCGAEYKSKENKLSPAQRKNIKTGVRK